MLQRSSRTLSTVLLLLPMVAHAHDDGSGGAHAFLQGLMHPLTGVDHLIFMLGLGFYAGYLGRRVAPWLGLVSMMALIAGSAPWSFGIPSAVVESGVLASLVLMGGAVVYGRSLHLMAALPAALMLAFVHGLAHGETAYAAWDRAAFIAGLVLTSGVLYAIASAKNAALQDGAAADRPANRQIQTP